MERDTYGGHHESVVSVGDGALEDGFGADHVSNFPTGVRRPSFVLNHPCPRALLSVEEMPVLCSKRQYPLALALSLNSMMPKPHLLIKHSPSRLS
jgi:hypothetical protein